MATTLSTGTSTGIATNRSTVVIALVPALLLAVPCAAAEVGPDNGVLVIVGGAAGPEILKLFAELAGGPDAPLVVIPTANGNPPYDDLHEAARFFREQAGVNDVVVIHTDDREEADSEDLRRADRTRPGSVVSWRSSVAPRRLLSWYPHPARARGAARTWWCDRRLLGRRHHPGLVSGAR